MNNKMVFGGLLVFGATLTFMFLFLTTNVFVNQPGMVSAKTIHFTSENEEVLLLRISPHEDTLSAYSWVTFENEESYHFVIAEETNKIKVYIHTPMGTPSGRYSFSLEIVGDETYEEKKVDFWV